MNEIITSFAPIANQQARVLILGSMPGVQSLSAAQYYAHKQNAFWRIIGDILDISPTATYIERIQKLIEHNIAVWDVLHSCVRIGSLDSAIAAAKENDFNTFYEQHPNIQWVFFNGAAAERYYRIHVLPKLKNTSLTLTYLRLPSTSPAHASLTYQAKLSIWKSAFQQTNQQIIQQ